MILILECSEVTEVRSNLRTILRTAASSSSKNEDSPYSLIFNRDSYNTLDANVICYYFTKAYCIRIWTCPSMQLLNEFYLVRLLPYVCLLDGTFNIIMRKNIAFDLHYFCNLTDVPDQFNFILISQIYYYYYITYLSCIIWYDILKK